jgi:hypothetical protein
MGRKRDPRLVKASFDVWLSRSIIFNNPPGNNIKVYRQYTKAEKVKYTNKIQIYLDRIENELFKLKHEKRISVAIKLDNIIRYVWREDILSKKEYDEVKERQQTNLRVLFKKSKGDVGKSDSS